MKLWLQSGNSDSCISLRVESIQLPETENGAIFHSILSKVIQNVLIPACLCRQHQILIWSPRACLRQWPHVVQGGPSGPEKAFHSGSFLAHRPLATDVFPETGLLHVCHCFLEMPDTLRIQNHPLWTRAVTITPTGQTVKLRNKDLPSSTDIFLLFNNVDS